MARKKKLFGFGTRYNYCKMLAIRSIRTFQKVKRKSVSTKIAPTFPEPVEVVTDEIFITSSFFRIWNTIKARGKGVYV